MSYILAEIESLCSTYTTLYRLGPSSFRSIFAVSDIAGLVRCDSLFPYLLLFGVKLGVDP